MGRLDRLLRPKSVAIVGGGSWCENVIAQLRLLNFSGDVWAVHPKKSNFGGVTTYPSVVQLPGAPDACFVGVNRHTTVEVVESLSKRGAGGAICFASGFREAAAELDDGAELQTALLAVAGDMPILGPNCYGLLNYLDDVALWPDQHGGTTISSGVAVVMQSSNIAINVTMQTRGLPIAYMVTAGNQAQIGMSAIGAELLDDPRVTALGLHIEGIDDLQGLEQLAAKAHTLGKPIVALKVGVSEQAKAATISHTASLAGSDAGSRALFNRLGIAQASSLEGMIEGLKLLHLTGPLSSGRIAAAACSGGEASLIADSVLGTGLEFPRLDEAQTQDLRAALGPKVALANPLDYHTYIWGNKPALAATFTALMRGDVAMVCVLLDFPRADRCDPSAWRPVIDAAACAIKAGGKPLAILSSLSDTMPEGIANELVEKGIVPLCGISQAIEAISIAAISGQTTLSNLSVLHPLCGKTGRVLSESEAKGVLKGFGVKLPEAYRASSPTEAARAANEIGFPIVLKGEGIAHKTEVGAVVLNLRSSAEVQAAAEAMPVEMYLIEEMVEQPIAELLIGVVLDDAHGYVLTLAAGGQLTEILGDRASLLVPATRQEVSECLRQLRIWPMLEGYRGRPGADLDAILNSVMAVQDYVCAERPDEIEINPLMCNADTAVVADVLIRTGRIQYDG